MALSGLVGIKSMVLIFQLDVVDGLSVKLGVELVVRVIFF